ncbi:hypothetical protein [Paenibacillus sp. HJGM_3]|uniref:hypothetical protein n=1 Tax=Paenibacillus sp. HJGM_3 TaxID=3379816 RepID=UPI00385BA17C
MVTKRAWSVWDELGAFEVQGMDANPSIWDGRPALYLNDCTAFLRETFDLSSFRLQADIACPSSLGFAGLVFGARDYETFELVYVSPDHKGRPGEIQYDPFMNGSSTWQVYHGPAYQAAAPLEPGRWSRLTLDVQPNGVAITVGDAPAPQLVIRRLQLGHPVGRIGLWSHLPAYFRNFTVEAAEPYPIEPAVPDLSRLAEDGFVTEWRVSEPYSIQESASTVLPDEDCWSRALVEENGTLNLNRLYSSEAGRAVQVLCTVHASVQGESVLSFGYSDQIRLWVNGEEVYRGLWKWDPPADDGRIRPNHATATVRLHAGSNTIRAEVASLETIFGWGICLKTDLMARS